MDTSGSVALYNRAKKSIPGGVNSPVRSFNSVGGNPLFISRAKGSYLYDVDGNRYIDYISSWGPMILGHAHEKVISAVEEAARNSLSFGAPNPNEVEIAELIKNMVPNIDKVRFVNSGTEACMSALRVARGFTGRNKLIKFEGCYHGHADPFLIKGGSGMSTLGVPNSPGVTSGTTADTISAPYNDIDTLTELVEANHNDLAAIIVEPVAGNMGCIIPEEGFLEKMRELCTRYGIVLIFDEVMTGFRLAKGGAQELLGIEADLVTYGKVIGGGMPVGAFGGREEIMSAVAPIGPVYQAGTLSGNPIAMASGLATLRELNENESIFRDLEEIGSTLKDGIGEVLHDSGVPHTINQLGSMISVHFTEENVVDFDSAAEGNNNRFKQFFHGMLNQGIYLPPSAFESWFLSVSLSDGDIDKTIEAVRQTVPNLEMTEV
jgi:glutamate-1-semialdehyde 2,1-aminomutase